MKKIKWKRPSGTTIETNDRKETIEKAVELGWKRARATKKKKE